MVPIGNTPIIILKLKHNLRTYSKNNLQTGKMGDIRNFKKTSTPPQATIDLKQSYTLKIQIIN